MEYSSDASPSNINGDISENHIFSNEKNIQLEDKVAIPREEDNEMFLNESIVLDNKSKNSVNEINNIPSNDINNAVTADKDFFNSEKENKFIDLENKQDSGIFEDVLRQECEVLNEDSNSLKEQNESLDKDDFFPDISKDNNTQEEDLVLGKGILEENEHEDESSVHHEAGIQADSAVSELLSLEKDADESDSEHEDQESEKYRSTRKEFSLPYFQLPKPDLDDFLTEMEINLGVSVKSHDSQLSEQSSIANKPKGKDIVTLKPPPNVKGNFDPKKVFITFDLTPESCKLDPIKNSNIPESKPKVSSGLLNNEYENFLSSLDADEEKPGAKRLVLKDFLKKQIDQKKFEAFNQFKVLNNMDEEMEELYGKEEDPETDDEDSSEEAEEATISFEKKDKNFEDEIENEVPEEFQVNEENSDEESDDDFIGVRKTKKKFLVLDEDSCDNDNFMNEEKRNCNLLSLDDSSSSGLPELPEIVKTKLDDNSDKLNMNDAEIGNRDYKLSKNEDSAFGTGIFQTSENNSIFSQISSSMPSFQPGGGFLNQDHRQENSSDSIISSTASQQNIDNTNEENENLYLRLQPEQNILRGVKTPVLENDSVLEKVPLTPSEDINNFGVKFDDLPVSQSVNDSDIFLTEELADVCSGAFNKAPSDDNPSDKTPETNLKFFEKVTDFFDDEAELSGEDDGIDEKDDSEGEGDYLGICASDEENLPEAEVLREEIADLHMKRLMDEDEERIKEIQEQFLDDGELDGAGRSRRFAWLNNDVDIAPTGVNSDSDSDAEAVDDSFALNPEKAKWRQENKEDENADLTEELNSSGYRRRSFLKVDIIGKPKFSHEEDSSRRISCKRPCGSYLNLDDSSASQVLKKLKASEDNLGGSRTTKHFVFRNDLSDVPASTTKVPVKSIVVESLNGIVSSKRKSVFSKI